MKETGKVLGLLAVLTILLEAIAGSIEPMGITVAVCCGIGSICCFVFWYLHDFRIDIKRKGTLYSGEIIGYDYFTSKRKRREPLMYKVQYCEEDGHQEIVLIESKIRGTVDPKHPVGTKVNLKVKDGQGVIVKYLKETNT